MENNNKKLIDKLNHLVSIANDGKYGYKTAAENVEDITLKQLFLQYSAEREAYAEELKNRVASLGGSSDEGGGPLGALHRTWIDLKAILTSGDREAILKACVTGEEAAVKAYGEALDESYLDSNIRQVITTQLSGIEAALNSIRSLVAVGKDLKN